MYLQNAQSACGRPIPKPEKLIKQEEVNDEAIPIQDQIENLRAKISLKERYNRVMKDEMEESRQGASTVLEDLYKETNELRQNLMNAVNAEKFAVQNALRTHRQFQLAMSDKTPFFAVQWLEDKLFDNAKCLNSLMNRLQEKRSKLEEAENMVLVIEKWPRPGSLPWEIAAITNFKRIENMVEAMKVKRETASILYSKYRDIKFTLMEEKGKYAPNLRNLENQLNFHKSELENLQKMLEDAVHFRDESSKNLSLTEKEASDNRKKRRKQMGKMKTSVQKGLEANQIQKQPGKVVTKLPFDQTVTEKPTKTDVSERLKLKRAEVEKFQDRARRLVETMRVPDLTHIPIRLKTVMALGNRLTEEQQGKEQLRDLLIRQRDQLILILCHYRYTGQNQEMEYRQAMEQFDTELAGSEKEMHYVDLRLQKLGDTTVNIRLGLIAIFERLDENKKNLKVRSTNPDLRAQLKMIHSKLRKLVEQIENLQSLFVKAADRNYTASVKAVPLPGRLIRVGSPIVSDESDEDDYGDFKVPGRLEIKARSAKIIQQALLKRGLH